MMLRLVFAALLAACAPAFGAEAASPPNRYAATLVPAERIELGDVLAERHGHDSRALILIPGLASGAWVWQDTVRQFMGEYTLYVLTLPGFDGRPAVQGSLVDKTQRALVELIESRKLAAPVLIGHSMGGTLALALAAQRPDLVGGVVSIDGLPVFPGTENLVPEQRAQVALTLPMRSVPQYGSFAEQQQEYMRGTGVIDVGRADELARLSANSDPAAVRRSVHAMFALDLRPRLPQIKAPVLVISPYFEPDATERNLSETDKTKYYAELLAGTPKLTVQTISPSRHFVMFDQPQLLADAIRSYLKSL